MSNRKPHCCPVCNGSQQVHSTLYQGLGYTTSIGMVPCRSCSGTGIVWDIVESDHIEVDDIGYCDGTWSHYLKDNTTGVITLLEDFIYTPTLTQTIEP